MATRKLRSLTLLLLLLLAVSAARHQRDKESPTSPSRPRHQRASRFVNAIDDDARLSQQQSTLRDLEQRPQGDALCPCISEERWRILSPISLTPEGEADLGPDFDLSMYGRGCAPHEANSAECVATPNCSKLDPPPIECDRSHCVRSWCYVDHDNCSVVHTPSRNLQASGSWNFYYSYATCGYMDPYIYTDRLIALHGQTLRVAFNHNSGGWEGAYNRDGSFAVNNFWEGPVVEFVRRAALQGGFNLNVIHPPEWLRPESLSFFGSNSSFDFCVYATSLGYVDLCVAAYTITDMRAGVATFFETSADPIFLITMLEETKTDWATFVQSIKTIFEPFTTGSWVMIAFFCLPVLGLLMLFHEYDAPGSAYPRNLAIVVRDVRSGKRKYKMERVSLVRHVITSLYMSYLAFSQESYDQCVVTPGGKVNLLAISTFVLLVLALYTANLAAILTSNIAAASVESVEDAVRKGYNFCSERKVAEIVMRIHKVDPNRIVPDPLSLGGDGLPGFNCPDCDARKRVFDYMRLEHNDKSLYCNAAFASWEDLQVLNSLGDHCDKQKVGDALAYQRIGIPLYSGWSDSIMTLFHRVRNEGVMDMELSVAEPSNMCAKNGGEGTSLSVRQLTGIWVVTFTFAIGALLVKLGVYCRRKILERSNIVREPLEYYDQWGNPTSHEVFVEGRTYHPDTVRDLARTRNKLGGSKDVMKSLDGRTRGQHDENDFDNGSETGVDRGGDSNDFIPHGNCRKDREFASLLMVRGRKGEALLRNSAMRVPNLWRRTQESDKNVVDWSKRPIKYVGKANHLP